MNSGCRVYEVEWWRWAAMVVLRLMNDDEKKLKEGIWWSEERCYEKWRKNWAWEEENTALKRKCEFRICSWGNAKISHSCEIPDREHGFSIFASKTNSHMVGIWFAFLWNSHKGFWEGTKSMFFLKLPQKHFRTRDVSCENFSQQEVLCENGWIFVFSPLFSLVFTMTSFFKLSYLNVNTKNQFKTH